MENRQGQSGWRDVGEDVFLNVSGVAGCQGSVGAARRRVNKKIAGERWKSCAARQVQRRESKVGRDAGIVGYYRGGPEKNKTYG